MPTVLKLRVIEKHDNGVETCHMGTTTCTENSISKVNGCKMLSTCCKAFKSFQSRIALNTMQATLASMTSAQKACATKMLNLEQNFASAVVQKEASLVGWQVETSSVKCIWGKRACIDNYSVFDLENPCMYILVKFDDNSSITLNMDLYERIDKHFRAKTFLCKNSDVVQSERMAYSVPVTLTHKNMSHKDKCKLLRHIHADGIYKCFGKSIRKDSKHNREMSTAIKYDNMAQCLMVKSENLFDTNLHVYTLYVS